jgi:hypothetical protein
LIDHLHLGKKRERNVWRIFEHRQGASNCSAHDLLTGCIEAFIQRLKPIANKVRERRGCRVFIHVTAEAVPGISFIPDVLRVLADAGMSLDVEIVLHGPEPADPLF